MPRVKVLHEIAYEDMLFEMLSDRQIDLVEAAEKNLATFPDMGSPLVRDSLVARFGPNLRKIVVDGYVLIYRHDKDAVRMLAALPGKVVG